MIEDLSKLHNENVCSDCSEWETVIDSQPTILEAFFYGWESAKECLCCGKRWQNVTTV